MCLGAAGRGQAQAPASAATAPQLDLGALQSLMTSLGQPLAAAAAAAAHALQHPNTIQITHPGLLCFCVPRTFQVHLLTPGQLATPDAAPYITPILNRSQPCNLAGFAPAKACLPYVLPLPSGLCCNCPTILHTLPGSPGEPETACHAPGCASDASSPQCKPCQIHLQSPGQPAMRAAAPRPPAQPAAAGQESLPRPWPAALTGRSSWAPLQQAPGAVPAAVAPGAVPAAGPAGRRCPADLQQRGAGLTCTAR